jgi:hypothetical protein
MEADMQWAVEAVAVMLWRVKQAIQLEYLKRIAQL